MKIVVNLNPFFLNSYLLIKHNIKKIETFPLLFSLVFLSCLHIQMYKKKKLLIFSLSFKGK